MDNPTILVIDSDPKNLQILKESLESSHFKVITNSDGNEAWGTIQSQKPDIVVSEVDIPGMDGFQLFERIRNDPLSASIPVVFLTNRRNLEDRLKSLRSGVKDYMIKPLHVKEVIARLNMILRRIDRIKTEESGISRKLTGRLEEVSVEHLVENYGVERKTGILTLYDQDNRSGEIYFREGSVVNARLGNFKAEKAVYQMLPWKNGHFMMTFKDVNVEDAITVSNLGLLLQGNKRLQDREKLTKQLPSLDTVFVKTTIFNQVLKKKTISTDALKFISLFDGVRSVNHIVGESTYDDVKTLERIIKLKEQGFICPKDSPVQAAPKNKKPPAPAIKPKPEGSSDFTEMRPAPQEPVKDKKKEPEFKNIREFEEFKLEFNIKELSDEEILPTIPEPLIGEKDHLKIETPPVPDDSSVPEEPAVNGNAISQE
ncbi:MAG: response regulator, partial [Caldithrix sp.]